MSLATWKKEFYRIPANKVSKRYALKHSIKKWIGLLPKNRKKHGVKLVSCILVDAKNNELCISGNSCALCEQYGDDCIECPLFSVNDYSAVTPCHDEYTLAMDTNRVVPMINLLRRAQQKQEGKVK